MKKSVFIIVTIILVVTAPGCSTLMFINQSYPPEIGLKSDNNVFAVSNHFDYMRPGYIKEKHEDIYRAGTNAFIDNLINSFQGSDFIRGELYDTLVPYQSGQSFTDILSEEAAMDLCNRYNSTHLLTFDSLYMGFDWETIVEEDDDGSRSKTKYFYLLYRAFVSLYDNEGALIDRSLLDLSMVYKARPTLSGLITIQPALAKAQDEAVAMASQAAFQYHDKFFTTVGRIPYKVYTGKIFKNSFRLMQYGNWEDAIKELIPMTSSGDPKIKKKAANNIAVCYLGLGNNPSADFWFGESRK